MNLCYGCTACVAICPTNAIKLQTNEKGFLVPTINETLCVHCNKCDNVCACKVGTQYHSSFTSFAFIHHDASVLEKSSSGGLFTALSDIVLDAKGIIYGASMNDNMYVHHIRAITREERDRMRGSKYVQSDLEDIFHHIKEDLKEDNYVLFTGTPCQVDGLKHFLSSVDTTNLITCDLVCNGVPSPLIWEEHVRLLEQKYHHKLKAYQFRTKKWGWSIHKECAYFDNNKQVHSTAYTELFKNLYYSRMIMRESCYTCPYASTSRVGDITIADCRNIENLYPQMNTFNGVSLALLNSEKGKQLFEKAAQNGDIYPVNLEKIMQPPLTAPGKKSARSDIFWQNYQAKGYEYAVKQQYGKDFSLKYFIKKLLHKV